jgi:hypothetical protein
MNFKEFKWFRTGSSSWLPEHDKELDDILMDGNFLPW